VNDPNKQRLKFQRVGMSMHSSAAAEKGDEGMALKIRTKAEGIPDGKYE